LKIKKNGVIIDKFGKLLLFPNIRRRNFYDVKFFSTCCCANGRQPTALKNMNTIKLILFVIISFYISSCSSDQEKAFDTSQYLNKFNTANCLIEKTPRYDSILKNNRLIPYLIYNLGLDEAIKSDSIWIEEQEDSITIKDRFYKAGACDHFLIFKDLVNDTIFIRSPEVRKAFVEIIEKDTNVSFILCPTESIFLLKITIFKTPEMRKYPVVYKNQKILN
jgi:hypothetical protein